MSCRSLCLTLPLLAALVACSHSPTTARTHSAEEAKVEQVIREMNQAASNKNLDGILACFAKDALQLRLHPAHSAEEQVSLSIDLAEHWRSFAPVLFTYASVYERLPVAVDVRVDDALASAWVSIRTRTERKDLSKPQVREFSECYTLEKVVDGWKIVAIASSRRPDARRSPRR